MKPNYTIYVRIYEKTAGGYPAGTVRFSAKVTGTSQERMISKLHMYKKVGEYTGVSVSEALEEGRKDFEAKGIEFWAGKEPGKMMVTNG